MSNSQKATLADKLIDISSEESLDLAKVKKQRAMTLSGIEESMVESSILHSLSDMDS
jgi:hypothetical protein